MRACRQSLQAGGATRDEAYAEVLTRARAGQFGAVPAGWVHEDFHLDDKDAAFAAVRRDGAKIGGEQLATVSRVYTPEPIVDFLLQNTLGALWLSMYPASRLRGRWPLVVAEAIGPPRPARPVTTLTVLDPCCGCGAFLLPALDMLLQMADEERQMALRGEVPAGWPLPADRAAGALIGANLWGAELDAVAVDHLRAAFRERTGHATDDCLQIVRPPLGSLAPTTFGDRRFDVVCTNPPFVGFRQLAPQVRDAVKANDAFARSDLAVAFQSRCVDLLAQGGRAGTVTPAGWTNGRESMALRRRILRDGGPCLSVALGQGVFAAAPLVFVALSVVGRDPVPDALSVRRVNGREGLDLSGTTPMVIPRSAIAELASLPFLPDAPPEVLACAARGPRLGERFRAFDGVWTGDNARDVRRWWELEDAGGWVRLSGGQGHQPWVAPIRLRIRAEHVAGQSARAGGVEYPRVAGGRLGARVAEPGTASLAGVVTLMPRDGRDEARTDEVLAIFNSAIGGAWLRTLTSGLNFNPGYAAAIPLAANPPGPELRRAVDEAIALRGRLVESDPTHDGFRAVPHPDEVSAWIRRLAAIEGEIDALVADHLEVPRGVVAGLPKTRRNPVRVGGTDDALVVAALRHHGIRWPCEPTASRVAHAEIVDVLAAVLADRGVVDVHPGVWLADRFATLLAQTFPRNRFRIESPSARAGRSRRP